MHFYKVKLLNLVQFDYYGGDLFRVKIFREYVVECKYPKRSPLEFMNNDERAKCRDEEYMVNSRSIEFQKACATWSFNAFRNCVQYYEIKIEETDVDYRTKRKVRIKKQTICYVIIFTVRSL